MARLDYEAFKDYCLKSIVTVLGEQEYKASFEPLHKTDEIVIDSIYIKKKGAVFGDNVPSFRVKEFYMDYCDGKPLGEIMLDIVNLMETALETTFNVNLSVLKGYDDAKKSLIIRPLSYIKNKKLLQNHVFRKHGDIALNLYLVMQHDEKGMGSAKVPRKTFLEWNLNEDYVLQEALENTARLYPPIIVPFEFTLLGPEYLEQVPNHNKFFMHPLMPFELLPTSRNMYYLSIDKGINGAIAAFYPRALETLSSILNDDLYLTLNCVRDAFVHPVSDWDLNAIKRAARSNPHIEPLDYLSSNIYKYTRSSKELTMLT
jgi:hypothetical protein